MSTKPNDDNKVIAVINTCFEKNENVLLSYQKSIRKILATIKAKQT